MCKRSKLQTTEVSKSQCDFINLGCIASYLNFLLAFPTKVPQWFPSSALFNQGLLTPRYIPDTELGAKRTQK